MRNVELMLTLFIIYGCITLALTLALDPAERMSVGGFEMLEEGNNKTNLLTTFWGLITFSGSFSDPIMNVILGIPFWLIVIYVFTDEVRAFIPLLGGSR